MGVRVSAATGARGERALTSDRYTEHNPGKSDLGDAQYADYWNTFNDNCAYFKEQKVGWFLHA